MLVVFLLLKAPKPPESARQKQTHTKFIKSARNWESARNLFCPLDDFKSARISQIWRRKPPSGNAVLPLPQCSVSVRVVEIKDVLESGEFKSRPIHQSYQKC
jgi:hypothetical protein